jgi:glycerophosphoryl diester phosphodiesterase
VENRVLHGWDSSGRLAVLLIAHRGAHRGRAGAPAPAAENTREAFLAALGARADGIETDVRLTADGVPVLSHDDEAADAGGAPVSISRTERARLPERVPSLADLLSIAAGKTALYLELKMWSDDDGFHSAAEVMDAIAPMVRGVPRVTISSFDPAAIDAARALCPGAPTGLGVLEGADPAWGIEEAIAGSHDELHLHESVIDADVLARARAAGLRVLGFTVNDPARVRELAALGAHGVFTDDPAGARAALSGR